MEPIWEKGVPPVRFDMLCGKNTTDVLIIGGGIAGILCAYKLKKAGVDCILVEAAKICGGISHNTTAKITLSHGMIYDKLISRFGEDKARQYLEAQIGACKDYSRLCSALGCDYQILDFYVYSLNDRDKIESEITALNRLGVDAEFSHANGLPFEVAGAVRVRDQAQFHPLKFLYGIAKDLPIYENSKVVKFAHHSVLTTHGEIAYKKLIIATHFPIINKHGSYFLKLYQHRSYVLALKGAQIMNGMYVDESDDGLSFRNYGELLLLGGGGHRTGKKGGSWKELEVFAGKYFKNAEIVGRWATQDCMTLDGVPYIGQYAASMPDVYVATGFNKWGITNAMVAADILCNQICGKKLQYANVFSPSRSVLHRQFAVNLFESAVGLITPTAPRCPHLGCALKYNHAEHSWDCPCHGSRFAEHGELIDNPATDDHRLLDQ